MPVQPAFLLQKSGAFITIQYTVRPSGLSCVSYSVTLTLFGRGGFDEGVHLTDAAYLELWRMNSSAIGAQGPPTTGTTLSLR